MLRAWASSARRAGARGLATEAAPKLRGAHLDKRTGKWRSSVTVRGERHHLGMFDTAHEAHEAYQVAKAGLAGLVGDTGASSARRRAQLLHPVQPVEGLVGVLHDRDAGTFEAVVDLPGGTAGSNGRPVQASGGHYPTADEAARAYDALARMYHGADAACNFPPDAYAAFEPPRVEERQNHLAGPRGQWLEPAEVARALEAERGMDVVVLDVRGKADGIAWLLLCTARSVAHMRRLSDLVFRALLDRRLKPPADTGDWGVEGRDGEDWMVVDCGQMVVNVMSAEARRAHDLEGIYGADARPEEDGDESDGGPIAVDADTMEPLSAEDIERAFGPDVARQVAGYASTDDESTDEDSEQSEASRRAVEDALSMGPRTPRAKPATKAESVAAAVAAGASRTEASEDPVTRWVAANPMPDEWMDKMEREAAKAVDDDGAVDEEWQPSGRA